MTGPWDPAGPSHTRGRGSEAEGRAAIWLEAQGYRIVDRNVRTRAGEIDIVAVDGDTLCFVEVKARASRRHGPAVGGVDRRKQRRVSRAAACYLLRVGGEPRCRFDVLGMEPAESGWRFQLIRDAFEAG